MRKSGTARAALIGNGLAWFGAALFVLGLAGERADAVFSGSWASLLGFGLLVAVAVGLVVAGLLDHRRIRTRTRGPRVS